MKKLQYLVSTLFLNTMLSKQVADAYRIICEESFSSRKVASITLGCIINGFVSRSLFEPPEARGIIVMAFLIIDEPSSLARNTPKLLIVFPGKAWTEFSRLICLVLVVLSSDELENPLQRFGKFRWKIRTCERQLLSVPAKIAAVTQTKSKTNRKWKVSKTL